MFTIPSAVETEAIFGPGAILLRLAVSSIRQIALAKSLLIVEFSHVLSLLGVLGITLVLFFTVAVTAKVLFGK